MLEMKNGEGRLIFRDKEGKVRQINFLITEEKVLDLPIAKEEKRVAKSEAEIEKEISEVLILLGVPAHLMGYQYLREAVKKVIYDFSYLSMLTKKLYPELAQTFNTTQSRVERAIRNAIEVSWERGDKKTTENIFGYTISAKKGKPKNSEFIAMIADKLRLDMI